MSGAHGLIRNPEAFMRVNFPHVALYYSMAILTACASQSRRDLGPYPKSTPDVISEEEIAGSSGTNVYEVVERSHPMFLISKVDLVPSTDRQVYLNGVRLGGLNELRLIPAKEVKEIRFVRAIDASAYGVGRSGGAILITSKAGR
jgi:hypothetical protein